MKKAKEDVALSKNKVLSLLDYEIKLKKSTLKECKKDHQVSCNFFYATEQELKLLLCLKEELKRPIKYKYNQVDNSKKTEEYIKILENKIYEYEERERIGNKIISELRNRK